MIAAGLAQTGCGNRQESTDTNGSRAQGMDRGLM
jgi:hypothetical protein